MARAGRASRKQLIELRAGEAAQVSMGGLAFSSAAPLTNSLKTHEYHMAPAEELSRGPAHNLGSGGQLLLFSRYWGQSAPTKNHPAAGISLASIDGHHVADIQPITQSDLSAADPWAGVLLDLTAGVYRLRVNTTSFGQIEQAVVITPGWQTQVFLLMRNFDDDPDEDYTPDPSTASIFMGRMGAGFRSDDSENRLSDLARTGLARNVSVLSPADVEQLLQLKFENPMLGLLGVHALLIQSGSNPPGLQSVIENLERLLESCRRCGAKVSCQKRCFPSASSHARAKLRHAGSGWWGERDDRFGG
jgi:hypothetical protein